MFAHPRDVARLGLMASAAIVLFAFESLVPKPLPWMKLGLGNLPVLVVLVSFGGGPALAVSATKLVVGGLLSGGFASPTFVIGGGAGLASWLVMVAVRRMGAGLFSVVGLSIWGALAHQLSQLVSRRWLYRPQRSVRAVAAGLVQCFGERGGNRPIGLVYFGTASENRLVGPRLKYRSSQWICRKNVLLEPSRSSAPKR